MSETISLHEFLDWHYGAEGDEQLRARLETDPDLNQVAGPAGETPLHVATRRYRTSAVEMLLAHGAYLDARNAHGKTAFAHAKRRRFHDLAELLENRGADTRLNLADELAVAIVYGELDRARALLAKHPEIAKTGNPEEDRLLADVAGRNPREPVALLIEAGADLRARALDGGTALHQAAWFGQPANARLLLDAGAPVDDFRNDHGSSPLGWAVHGSRYSGGAEERQEVYAELVKMFLAAGSSLRYPEHDGDRRYLRRLREEASPPVASLLPTIEDSP